MSETTTTVGDTEVVIRETEDGFEVEEAEPKPEEGLYVRGTSGGGYGFEIPLSEADRFEVWRDDDAGLLAAWDTEANVDGDLRADGYSEAKRDGFDGYASISSVEIVER